MRVLVTRVSSLPSSIPFRTRNITSSPSQQSKAAFSRASDSPGNPDDTVQAILGEPGHRWVTAFGTWDGNTVTLDVELTSGGVFEATSPAPEQEAGYGSWTMRFNDCNSMTLVYDFPDLGLSGVMDLIRLADDNVDLCLELGFP